MMSTLADRLVAEALSLEPLERAAVIERLLSSLDQPDPQVDEKWAAEAEDRLRGFQQGDIEAFSAEQVFEELRRS